MQVKKTINAKSSGRLTPALVFSLRRNCYASGMGTYGIGSILRMRPKRLTKLDGDPPERAKSSSGTDPDDI